jgi:type IV pilus assembly protein PilQ
MNLESVQEGNVIRISTVRRLREEREELRRAQEAAREVEPLQVVYLKINYAKARKLGDMIGGRRGGGGSGGAQAGASGGDTGVLTQRGSVLVDEFTNTLVVRDIERGVSNARELVRRLDVQTPQILIESRIVEANSNLARELGVQWGYRASVGPQTGTSTGSNFPGTVGFGGSGLGTGAGGLPFIADFPAAGNLAAGNGSALDLMLGSLDGVHSLDVRISALEEKGQAKIISRPRVVTLNNVSATIKSLTILRVRLPSTGTVISTGAGGNAGTAQSATEKIETGIVLTVTPQVSSDGFVMLDMFAKSSQADFTRTVDNIPTEITREASSHVLIRDGETVVLGGIYRDQQDYQTRGIPFLKDIPGLGWLFRANSRNNRREDLLVFMTPRIVGGNRMAGGQPSAAELWERRDDAIATYEGEPG